MFKVLACMASQIGQAKHKVKKTASVQYLPPVLSLNVSLFLLVQIKKMYLWKLVHSQYLPSTCPSFSKSGCMYVHDFAVAETDALTPVIQCFISTSSNVGWRDLKMIAGGPSALE